MPSAISNGKHTRYPKSDSSIVMDGNDTDQTIHHLIHLKKLTTEIINSEKKENPGHDRRGDCIMKQSKILPYSSFMMLILVNYDSDSDNNDKSDGEEFDARKFKGMIFYCTELLIFMGIIFCSSVDLV